MAKIIIELDDLNSVRTKHFHDHYEMESIIGNTEEKYWLGDETNKVCRFCARAAPSVTFNMDAHVIPQFLGNRNLLSHFECDECNQMFSKHEDSFANFLGVGRTFSQIKGQTRKVPKFKDPKTGLEVGLGNKGIELTMVDGTDAIEIDHAAKKLKVTTQRPSYIPLSIPKCIIKMGLSMLTDEELKHYDRTLRFLMSSEYDGAVKDNPMLWLNGYFIPGPPKYPTPFVQIYKKKESKKDSLIPYRLICLSYSNYLLQMILPFSTHDEWLQGKQIDLPIAPLLIDSNYFTTHGPYQTLSLNLTSNEKKKSDPHKITFSFETFIDRTIDPATQQ